MGFDKKTYDYQYKKDNFEQVNFFVPKGSREKIKAQAANKGMNISSYIKDLITKDAGHDIF